NDTECCTRTIRAIAPSESPRTGSRESPIARPASSNAGESDSPSRRDAITTTGSAASRRSANANARADGSSSHCASSTKSATGPLCASQRKRLRIGHREGEPVDVRAGTPDRSEQRRSLRLGERRQVTVQNLPECVSERRKRELRFDCRRPAAEDAPAATPCLLVGGCKQRRLPDPGLALEEESAGPLQVRFENLPDRVQLGVAADDRFRSRCDRHSLHLRMWRL